METKLQMNELVDLYNDGVLPELDDGLDLAQEAQNYRELLITYIQKYTTPEFSQHFPAPIVDVDDFLFADAQMSAPELLPVNLTEATMVRNLKALHNAVILFERAYPLLTDDKHTSKLQLITILPDIYVVFKQFDAKTSEQFNNFMGYMRAAHSQEFKRFESVLPQLSDYIKGAAHRWGENISAPFQRILKKVDSLLINVPQVDQNLSNKTMLERLAVEIYPDFQEHIDDKATLGLYNLENPADTNTIRLIKAVANTLDLHSRLLMQDKQDKNLFQLVMEAIASGALIQEQLWSIEVSAAINDQAASGFSLIQTELGYLLEVARAFVIEIDRLEDQLCLQDGFIYEQVQPWFETLMKVVNQADIPLSQDDQNLFKIARQKARQHHYSELQTRNQYTAELKARVLGIEDLLDRSTPIGEFTAQELQFIQKNLSLLRLPNEMSFEFDCALDYALDALATGDLIEDSLNFLFNQFERVQNFIGRGFSLQRRVHSVASNLSLVVETDENDVELACGVIANRGIEFLPEQVELVAEYSQEALVQRAQDICDNDFSLKTTVKQFREALLYSIEKYAAEPIADNIAESLKGQFYTVYSDDAADVANIKFVLNATRRLSAILNQYETSYLAVLFEANEIVKTLPDLKLDSTGYNNKFSLIKSLIFNTTSEMKSLYGSLLGETNQMMMLREPEPEQVDVKQDDNADVHGQVTKQTGELIDLVKELALNEEDKPKLEESERYEWLKDQLQQVEDRVNDAIHSTFNEDISRHFVRNKESGFFDIRADESVLISDLKNLMNAVHHLTIFAETRTHDPYNLKLPIWLARINSFTISLNKVDLRESHEEVQQVYRMLLDIGQRVTDEITDPVARRAMARAEEIEALGFKSGTFSRPVQYAVEKYQGNIEMLGIKISQDKADGFLGERLQARQQVIEKLCKLAIKIEIKELPVFKKLNQIALECEEQGYKTIDPVQSKVILKSLKQLGFDDLHTKLYEVGLNRLAPIKSDDIKVLMQRIEQCYQTVDDKLCELAHQVSILQSHQSVAQAQLQHSAVVHEKYEQIQRALAAARSTMAAKVSPENTAEYILQLSWARGFLKEAQEASKLAKSLKCSTQVNDAQKQIKKLVDDFVLAYDRRLKQNLSTQVASKSAFATLFENPPSNLLELLVRLVEVFIAALRKLINKADEPAPVSKMNSLSTDKASVTPVEVARVCALEARSDLTIDEPVRRPTLGF